MLFLVSAFLVLAVYAFFVTFKLYCMRKSLKEILYFTDMQLEGDTNKLITISSADKYLVKLAERLNEKLAELRRQRLYYQNGSRELKIAVTNVSHDIRTPLTAVCGYLELIEKEEKSEEARRYLGYVRERTDTLKKLTEELFRYSVAVSSVDDVVCEAVCINSVLEDALADFYVPLTQRGIIPHIDIREKSIYCRANKEGLSRVFGNVLSNAVKYSGGDLEVTLRDDGEIIFSNYAVGLDKVSTEKLFDRFYTVDGAGRSTGLGLSIAKMLAERMGGRIFADYSDNRLSITLSFPLCE